MNQNKLTSFQLFQNLTENRRKWDIEKQIINNNNIKGFLYKNHSTNRNHKKIYKSISVDSNSQKISILYNHKNINNENNILIKKNNPSTTISVNVSYIKNNNYLKKKEKKESNNKIMNKNINEKKLEKNIIKVCLNKSLSLKSSSNQKIIKVKTKKNKKENLNILKVNDDIIINKKIKNKTISEEKIDTIIKKKKKIGLSPIIPQLKKENNKDKNDIIIKENIKNNIIKEKEHLLLEKRKNNNNIIQENYINNLISNNISSYENELINIKNNSCVSERLFYNYYPFSKAISQENKN